MNHGANMKRQQGFTIIELSLAMTFISILLLTIALTLIQIANIYTHGSIVKELNATSRAVNTELSTAIRASGDFTTTPSAHRYKEVPNVGGRMCLGQYSYIWNYGKSLSTSDSERNLYVANTTPVNANMVTTDGGSRYEISFVKVPDSTNGYCTPDAEGNYKAVDPVGAVELLRTGDHGIVLHSLQVTPPEATAKDANSSQQLYKISYTLGTSNVAALNGTTTEPPTECRGPGEEGADLNYCSIQQFTLVLRVAGEVN